MSDCKCIIWHPQTEDERAAVKERLDYARKVGDSVLTMIYLANLAGPCLTKDE